MSKKESRKKYFGEGKCSYRLCGVTFPKKREDQKYCCNDHRLKEWNLQNPRMSEDEKKQVTIQFKLPPSTQVTVEHGLSRMPDYQGHYDPVSVKLAPKDFFEKKTKRTFHYSRIDRDNKRGAILRKTLYLLLKNKPSTREINEHSGSTRASSDISELRKQGFEIECIPCDGINRFQLTIEGMEKALKFFKEKQQSGIDSTRDE